MKIRVDAFLNRPFIKAMLLSVSTLLIGGLCSALGNWDFRRDTFFIFKVIFLLIIFIIYIILLAYYSTKETNERKTVAICCKQNKAFESIMTDLLNLYKKNAEGANKVIRHIIHDGEINLDLWNFDDACFLVCQSVYSLLCTIGTGKDFEVIYDRLDESVKPEIEIYANSYANKDKKKPSVYKQRRNIQDDDFHDTELFRENQSDTEIILGSEEIDKVFGHRTKGKRNKNKNKYNQYIAIPVFCNDEKMIGLFEIVCLNKTCLGKTKEEIDEIISKYFRTYAYFILVLHKLEKALVTQP